MKRFITSSYNSFPSICKNVGVIVIQEWWGIDEHIKSLTIKFADQNYPAMAPDLYHGKIANEPDEAQKLRMEMKMEDALLEIKGCLNLLHEKCEKVVLIGFCMGGLLALKAGEVFPVDGILAFYPGGYDPHEDDINAYTSPVRIFVGDKDPGYDESKFKNVEASFKQKNKDFQLHVYKDADHAFMNDTRARYNKEVADNAWDEVWEFLKL
jgi:carboxymethylenebutenolidase